MLLITKLCGRTLRVDHVENYRLPKHLLEKDEQVETIISKSSATGHAYQGKEMANAFNLERGQDLFAPPSSSKEVLTTASVELSFVKIRDVNGESSVQRKERKRLRKESKHRKRSHKEDRMPEPHRSSWDRNDDDDNTSRKKRKRKHR